MGQAGSTPTVAKVRGPILVAGGPITVAGGRVDPNRVIRKEITEEKACYQADQVVVQINDGTFIREQRCLA